MTWRNKRDHINNYTCKWRRSKLGKTNPNHHYFAKLLKKETNDYLISNKEYLLAYKPEIYYSMKGQKLPKKYQQKQGVSITPVNAFVPPQSKLSKNELREQLNKEAEERKLASAANIGKSEPACPCVLHILRCKLWSKSEVARVR